MISGVISNGGASAKKAHETHTHSNLEKKKEEEEEEEEEGGVKLFHS